jgi:hypothetical protein
VAVPRGTGILPRDPTIAAKVRNELGSLLRAKTACKETRKKTWLRRPFFAALLSIAALQGGHVHAAEDPACSATGINPPCQFFPPGPSVADHSGTHDSEFFWILFNAYADEWNRLPPDEPNGPPTRRTAEHIAPAPQTSPPYPFTDWPFGGTEVIGGATPNSIDSPLMKALIGGTPFGKPLEDAHVQVYGWVAVGANVSTAHGFGGNNPASYAFTPDTVELDQAVVYIERVPDTVQKDRIDWGFRLSPIYGENYRYTTALGLFSNQLVYQNHFNGFDLPMAYAELYVPWVAEGVIFRLGRYISVPDIEAQLAPNNYMYSHSITYTFDNYTNTGLMTSVKLNRNWMAQFGVSAGTETFPWNAKITSIPGYTGPRDPGAQPTFTGCVQYETNNAWDNVYLCANDINNGQWGYNNLQWFGGTWFHNFTDKFHVSIESYYEFERGVRNINNSGGSYFGTPWLGMANPPNQAHCSNPNVPSCTANEYGLLAYWNYRIGTFDNLSLRTEYYDDINGQRTGIATRYIDVGIGWQHWFGPQVEIRPEITYYRSIDNPAFSNGTQSNLLFVGGDVIWHF